MRAAIYARVSSRLQHARGSSLATQLARCRDHAAARGYRVVGTFEDVHTGADLLGRPRLGALRAAVRAGEVDVVVALTVDRLSRDLVHLHFLLVEAGAAGARLEFVLDDLAQTPEGRLLRAVQGFTAEIERRTIRERVRRAARARIDRGLVPGLTAPFGFRWRDGERGILEADEDAATVVRRVFAALAGGSPVRDVAAALNAEAIPTARKSPHGWAVRDIHRIVRNPVYKGEPFAYRRGGDETDLAGRRSALLPATVWTPIPGCHPPPLVPPAVWAAANARLDARQGTAFPDPFFPGDYLLAGGIARCGLCGRPLIGGGRRAGALFYRCDGANRREAAPCRGARVDARGLDELVWRRVLRTAAAGGPRPATSGKAAGHLVTLDAGAEGAETGLAAGGDEHPGELAGAFAWDGEIGVAWHELATRFADDPDGLRGLAPGERHPWLTRLGLLVRVWPRGTGRMLEVTSRVDPAQDGVPRRPLLRGRPASRPGTVPP